MQIKERLPEWFRVQIHSGESYARLSRMLSERGLNTVCQGARCPNIWECWNHGTATLMILGESCTRNCRFCGVPHDSSPQFPDPDEPEQAAGAVESLGLDWAVITSVTRDDLPDGGAEHFAMTVRAIHNRLPRCGVEILIPDLHGNRAALETVSNCGAQVIAHNVETVPRLYPAARPQADYTLSLRVLRELAGMSEGRYTVKSSRILGLGETEEELLAVFVDLRTSGCTALTLGQYLPPGRNHLPVKRYWTPEEFDMLAGKAREAGIERVASGPKVRSSYHSHELAGRSLRSRGDGTPPSGGPAT